MSLKLNKNNLNKSNTYITLFHCSAERENNVNAGTKPYRRHRVLNIGENTWEVSKDKAETICAVGDEAHSRTS